MAIYVAGAYCSDDDPMTEVFGCRFLADGIARNAFELELVERDDCGTFYTATDATGVNRFYHRWQEFKDDLRRAQDKRRAYVEELQGQVLALAAGSGLDNGNN